MDNNMTAIVSVIMISLGFLNGMIVSALLDKYEIEKLNKRLLKMLDSKLEAEDQVEELQRALENERLAKSQLISKLNALTRNYSYLPPPSGPLERSVACSESDSDTNEFNLASPEIDANNKD